VRVLGHRPVEELDLATVRLQFLEQEHPVDVVAGQPVGVGEDDPVERGHGHPVAEAVEPWPLEGGPAVPVVTEDVLLREVLAGRLDVAPEPIDLLVDGLRLGLPLGRDADVDRGPHRWSPW
jgi:hypothetical protein